MKWNLIYILIFFVGILKYLPIPNVPNNVVEIIQDIPLPFLAIFIITYLGFKTKQSGLIKLLIPLLFIFMFFPPFLRKQLCNHIISQNNRKPIELVENVVAGAQMRKYEERVDFEWDLAVGGFESLTYKPNHGYKTDNYGKEILIVVGSNWYISTINEFADVEDFKSVQQ